MATKNLKSLTFPELDNTYVVPQVDATLSIEGRPADAEAVGDALETKADVTDVDVKADKNGDVAIAERLYGGKYTENSEPYFFRPVPVDMAGSVEECIVGGSLAWNQLVKNGNFESASGWSISSGVPSVSDNVASYTASSDGSMSLTLNRSVNAIADHKVLAMGEVWCDSNNEYRILYPFISSKISTTASTWTALEIIGVVSTGSTSFGIQSNSINGALYKYRKAMLIDLTTLFGSSTIADYIYSLETANAGAGVAWLKKYCPKLFEYNEYDAGSIKSVEGLVSHDTVGFNQWDEEWELGYYNISTGTPTSANDRIRSKNKIPVIPNTSYCFSKPTGKAMSRLIYYDANGDFLRSVDVISTGNTSTVITIDSDVHYVNFNMGTNYGTTYNHDICINLSDPLRNGQYEPYEKHSYPLDSTLTIRGVAKLVDGKLVADGDWYEPNGKQTVRYGEDDLGDYTWSLLPGDAKVFFHKIDEMVKDTVNVLCSKYDENHVIYTSLADKQYTTISAGIGSASYLAIRDDSYSNATAFKTAVTGQKFVYELATPTTFEAEPYQELQVVDSSGTEEYVSTGLVPVGHDSKYYEDVMKKVNGLPANFATLIAPTEATFKATRNYSVGSYLIVDNTLYKVTSAISNGGTITPNTNVTATTIMAEILVLA